MRNKRRILTGVPKIGMECHYFNSALTACCNALRPDAPLGYVFLDGMSGAAFGLAWIDLDRICDDITAFADWPAPVQRACAAAGYRCRMLTAPPDSAEARALYRTEIVASIDRGVPVLATGVYGPPTFGAIVGYDDEGETLLGTSFFQNFWDYTPDPEYPQYYRQRDWTLEGPRLVLLDGPADPPPLPALYREALAWAIQVARLPRIPGHPDVYAGHAAFTAWADNLANDALFEGEDLARDMRYLDTNGGGLTTLYGRCRTGDFLRAASEQFPAAAAELHKAAALHDRIWNEAIQRMYGPDVSPEAARIYVQPETRRKNAALLLQARDWEIEATDWIEQALAKLPVGS